MYFKSVLLAAIMALGAGYTGGLVSGQNANQAFPGPSAIQPVVPAPEQPIGQDARNWDLDVRAETPRA
jgi:hypothetical protein